MATHPQKSGFSHFSRPRDLPPPSHSTQELGSKTTPGRSALAEAARARMATISTKDFMLLRKWRSERIETLGTKLGLVGRM
jgi:hypothetical protein